MKILSIGDEVQTAIGRNNIEKIHPKFTKSARIRFSEHTHIPTETLKIDEEERRHEILRRKKKQRT